MAKIYGQLEKAQLENLSADPTPPSTGLAYWNTTLVNPRVYDGTVWQNIALGSAATPTFNVRASEGAGTTTLVAADNHNQRFDLSADRNVELPSALVAQGDLWIMANPNPYQLKIRAADSSDIIFSWGSRVMLVALVNTPATNTDWAVVGHDVLYGNEKITYSTTFDAGAVVDTSLSWWQRVSIREAIIHVYLKFGAGSSGNFSATLPSGLTIDTSLYPLGSGANIGWGAAFQSPANIPGFPAYSDPSTLFLFSGYNLSGFAAQGLKYNITPNLNVNDHVELEARVLITEWKEI